jgi:hypothetical protein
MPATLPKTKTYRVATLAVRYAQPRLTLGADGQDMVVNATAVGRFGDEVDLTDAEAKRLEELGPLNVDGSRRPAIKPKDEPLTYDEMSDKQLDALIKDRGISVTGSGANGEALTIDKINALTTFDQGQGSAA